MTHTAFRLLLQARLYRYLIIGGAAVKMLESCNDVLAESWCKNILLGAKLVPGLSDNGVDDIQSRNFVFWFALFTWSEAEGWCEKKALLRPAHVRLQQETKACTDSMELTFWINFSTLWTTCL